MTTENDRKEENGETTCFFPVLLSYVCIKEPQRNYK